MNRLRHGVEMARNGPWKSGGDSSSAGERSVRNVGIEPRSVARGASIPAGDFRVCHEPFSQRYAVMYLAMES
jgi:hypothetical protein